MPVARELGAGAEALMRDESAEKPKPDAPQYEQSGDHAHRVAFRFGKFVEHAATNQGPHTSDGEIGSEGRPSSSRSMRGFLSEFVSFGRTV